MFDKVRCIENIYMIAKEKNLKIGDLEAAANVSKGYMSRVSKPDYTGSPSIEFIDAIASKLGVGIDYLANCSLDTLNGDERILYDLFDKLKQKTAERKLNWVCQKKRELMTEDIPDSAFFVENEVKYIRQKKYHYESSFAQGDVLVNGDFYKAQLPDEEYEDVRIYLNSVIYSIHPQDNTQKNVPSIEIYLDREDFIPICSTALIKEELRKPIEQLYNSLGMCYSVIELDSNTKDYFNYLIKDL